MLFTGFSYIETKRNITLILFTKLRINADIQSSTTFLHFKVLQTKFYKLLAFQSTTNKFFYKLLAFESSTNKFFYKLLAFQSSTNKFFYKLLAFLLFSTQTFYRRTVHETVDPSPWDPCKSSFIIYIRYFMIS